MKFLKLPILSLICFAGFQAKAQDNDQTMDNGMAITIRSTAINPKDTSAVYLLVSDKRFARTPTSQLHGYIVNKSNTKEHPAYYLGPDKKPLSKWYNVWTYIFR